MSNAAKLYQFLHTAGRAPAIHTPHGAIQVGERKVHYNEKGDLFVRVWMVGIPVPLWWAKRHLNYDAPTGDTEQSKFLATRRAKSPVVGAKGNRDPTSRTARN